jgi:hypothetical protein
MRVSFDLPRFSLLSVFLLLAILWISHQLDTCAFDKAESDFWFETTAAFTAVSIHLIMDRNLVRLRNITRRLSRREPK